MTDIALYILFLGALIFSFYAQIKVQTTFKKFSQVPCGRGRSASEVARRILDSHGLFDVKIELVNGNLTDHYDPRTRVLRLSRPVYSSYSAAAVGVAAHEVGHAIQHSEAYKPLVIRGKMVPVVSFASNFSWIAIILGIVFMSFSAAFSEIGSYILLFGVGLFALTTLFHLVTLPVELNASRRALTELELTGWYSESELRASKSVLSAAAMTYIAALAVSLIQLLRLVSMFRGRER